MTPSKLNTIAPKSNYATPISIFLLSKIDQYKNESTTILESNWISKIFLSSSHFSLFNHINSGTNVPLVVMKRELIKSFFAEKSFCQCRAKLSFSYLLSSILTKQIIDYGTKWVPFYDAISITILCIHCNLRRYGVRHRVDKSNSITNF